MWQAQIAIVDADAPNYGTSSETPGSYEIIKRYRSEFNHDFLLNLDQKLSEDIDLNGMAGVNVNDQRYNYVKGEVKQLDVPGFYNLNNGTVDPLSEQYKRQRRLFGAIANVDLAYRNYLYLTLSARNDWSSTLPKDNNSYFYPGITTSLLINDLLADQGISVGPINLAKVRVAYGWTGKDADPYVIDPVFVKGNSGNPGYPNVDDLEFPLNNINSWMVGNRLGSPDLAPEITKEFETGFELMMWNRRLGIEASYYNKLTEGLIEDLPLDPSTGYSVITKNLGDVRNKGIEAMVYGTPLKVGDFSWEMSLNFTKNKNKVVKLEEGEISLAGFGGMSIVAIEGEEMGLFKTTVPQTVMIDGVEHVVVDGNGMVMASPDQEVIKDQSIQEKFRLGYTNTFKWKGFRLGTTFDFRYGGYMYSYQKDYMRWTGSDFQSTYNERRTFIVPNSVVDNGDGTYSENTTPVSSESWHTFYSNGAFERDNHAIIDKSYLKLREVSLSYDLPKSVCEKIKMEKITASLVVNNILLWTPAENSYIDPETTTFGNDIYAKFGEFGAGPTNQFYTFGVSAAF